MGPGILGRALTVNVDLRQFEHTLEILGASVANGALVNRFSALFKIPEDFGAVAGDVGDQSVQLQRWLDYCVENRVPAVIPAGRVYRYSASLQAGSGSSFDCLRLTGLGGQSGLSNASVLHYTGSTGVALALQGLWSSTIDGLTIRCDSTQAVSAAIAQNPDPAAYVSEGFSTARWHPHAALAIDPYSGSTPPDGGYPGKSYGQVSSSGVTIRHCTVEGAVIGFFNSGGEALASSIRIENCHAFACAYAFVTCFTQARLNAFTNFVAGCFHTMIDSRTFGAQNGAAPKLSGVECSVGWRLFNVTTTFDCFSARDLYTEAVPCFGVIDGAHPASFDACHFGHDAGVESYIPIVHGYLGCPATFTACKIGTRSPFWNLVGSTRAQYVSYHNCLFTEWTDQLAEYKVMNAPSNGNARVALHGCTIGRAHNAEGWAAYNTHADVDAIAGMKLPISAHTRSIRTHGASFGYPAGEAFVRPAWDNRYPTVSSSDYEWNGSTLTLSAAANELLAGDILFWRVEANQLNVPRDHINDLGDLVPALRVTAVTGQEVTAVAMGAVAELDTSFAPSAVYVAVNDWVPLSAISLTLTSGQVAATLGNANDTLKAGDWVMAASGLAANTRVVSKVGTAVTLSKPAMTNGQVSVYCSRLQLPV